MTACATTGYVALAAVYVATAVVLMPDAWEDMMMEQKQEQKGGGVFVVLDVVVIEFDNVYHHLFILILQLWAGSVLIAPTP